MYVCYLFVFFFKQKTAYEMRISDWSSDVCSSDLALLEHRGTVIEVDQRGARVEIGNDPGVGVARRLSGIAEFEQVGDIRGDRQPAGARRAGEGAAIAAVAAEIDRIEIEPAIEAAAAHLEPVGDIPVEIGREGLELRSEEHTSELQSLMRISY